MTHIKPLAAVFLKKVEALIEEYGLLSSGDSVLVGLSGGADSVALLLALCELRAKYQLKLSCAHVNHMLRKETADRDTAFVTDLCNRLQLPLFVLKENVGQFAEEHRLSIEDAGRQVRYAFFQKHAKGKIATAHTKDDTAETVLFNLLKGNLPLGIAPVRGQIIRPLLGVTKEEIYAYLRENNQPYVTDETNFTLDYTRNRIRLELIPYLEEKFNKNFTNTVYNTSEILYREQKFLEQTVQNFLEKHATFTEEEVNLPASALIEADVALARKVIRHCYYQMSDGHLSFEQIQRVLALCRSGRSGQQIVLPEHITACLFHGTLVLGKQTEIKPFCYTLLPEIPVEVPEIGCTVCLTRKANGTRTGNDTRTASSIRTGNAKRTGSAWQITYTEGACVELRSRRDGDRIFLKKNGVHKKVSDFFIDKKIPRNQRNKIPLVTVDGEIQVIADYFWEKNLTENVWYITITKQ